MSALLKILLFMVAIGFASLGDARPGGGHSSSSSSSHSSSHSFSSGSSSWSSHSSYSSGGNSYSGGNNSGGLDELINWLVILVVIIIVLYLLTKANQQAQMVSSSPTTANRASEQAKLKQQLEQLKQTDPNFSGILFSDFVGSLYHKFYSYTNRPEFAFLQPFLASSLQTTSIDLNNKQINEIVINGMRWLDISTSNLQGDQIALEIAANYTAQTLNNRARYTVSERWQFRRQSGVKSLPPDKMHSVCCPHCGAAVEFIDSGNCKHCGQFVETGATQWYLANRSVLSASSINNQDLVSYSEEEGTALPSIIQLDFQAQCEAFAFLHNQPWEAFRQTFTDTIVKPYFLAIYQHWSERTWAKVRHLLSDRLYESNRFWLNMYQEYNYINRLDALKIDNVNIVKIEIDHFYEAITARIFATCLDYTVDAQGKVIGGSQRNPRRYSEYWTFVRYKPAESKQAAISFDLETCPQCGAPADNMGQAGVCGYCDAKISTGEFSWVLYMITQDEAYAG